MKTLIKSATEYVSALNRRAKPPHDPVIMDKLVHLRTRGFVMLDHLVGDSTFKKMQSSINKKIGQDFDLEFPCLAQTKVDPKRGQDLININFLATNEQLYQRS